MFAFKSLFTALAVVSTFGLSNARMEERRHPHNDIAARFEARHDQPADITSTIEGATQTITSDLGTFTSTIIVSSVGGDASSIASSVVATASAAVSSISSDGPKSLTDILNEVVAQIQPLTVTLNGLTKETATEEKVTEITDELKSILNIAIEEVNSLVSSPLEGLLGLLDIGGLGQLIGTLLNLVFGALGFVLSIVSNPAAIKPLLVAVGELVGELLTAILGLGPLGSLVGGLLATVLGLVGDVTNVISDLGLTQITSLLGL